MSHRILFVACALLTAAPASANDDDDPPPPSPPVFQAVVDCRAVADPAERLACYDRTVEAMETAKRERELAVFDRDAMREARRGVFGLGLRELRVFDADESEEVTEIDSTITAVRNAGDGFPIFVLADGARWKQTDGRNVFARPGQTIHIRQAALGSYMANVNGRVAVRVIRLAN